MVKYTSHILQCNSKANNSLVTTGNGSYLNLTNISLNTKPCVAKLVYLILYLINSLELLTIHCNHEYMDLIKRQKNCKIFTSKTKLMIFCGIGACKIDSGTHEMNAMSRPF
jgi:hypothetical protein